MFPAYERGQEMRCEQSTAWLRTKSAAIVPKNGSGQSVGRLLNWRSASSHLAMAVGIIQASHGIRPIISSTWDRSWVTQGDGHTRAQLAMSSARSALSSCFSSSITPTLSTKRPALKRQKRVGVSVCKPAFNQQVASAWQRIQLLCPNWVRGGVDRGAW